MNRKVLARIDFLSREEGGRIAPPTASPYCTLVRLPSDGPDYPAGRWTAIVDLVAPLSDGSGLVTVELAASDAPRDELCSGERLELFEGRRAVARLYILAVGAPLEDVDIFVGASQPARVEIPNAA